jgi:hypothetical protein
VGSVPYTLRPTPHATIAVILGHSLAAVLRFQLRGNSSVCVNTLHLAPYIPVILGQLLAKIAAVLRLELRGDSSVCVSVIHPTPYTLHHTRYTLHPTPYILHPTPDTLHPTPHTIHQLPHTIHHTPYAMYHSPCTTPHAPRITKQDCSQPRPSESCTLVCVRHCRRVGAGLLQEVFRYHRGPRRIARQDPSLFTVKRRVA